MNMPLPEREIRKEKMDAFLRDGINPYPSTPKRTANCADALESFASWSASKKQVALCGRIIITRVHGGLLFADLKDASGKIQLLLKEDVLGKESFARFRDRMDPGDFAQAEGILVETKRGEKSLEVSSWGILSKALLPLPDKFHGLQDREIRYRHRELDLISNPEAREIFRSRTKIISAFRRALEEEGFEEVETPIFQPIAGGATARPFITHHNALDIPLYLRIAPELYLKRLVVGGYEKVFEIGRQFRNEGIDWTHNPEFTSIEFYWAYKDYRDLMDFTEKLICRVISEVNGGSLKVTVEGETVDFLAPWPRVRFREAALKETGIDIEILSQKELVAEMKKLKIEADYSTAHIGKLYDELYSNSVRKKQVQPMFVTDYPIEMEPLAKKCEDNPRYVQRFQLLAAGRELIKAYSELNDPIDQRERFMSQQELHAAGDLEAQTLDEAFLIALEHGMPPTAGWGMGVDRFVALITGAHGVKDVILFPTLKPEQKDMPTKALLPNKPKKDKRK